MSSYHYKITNDMKLQERIAGSYEIKRKLKEIFPEEAQALDLWDKDFKTTLSYMLKGLMESRDKGPRKIKRMMSQFTENINKEIEIVKRTK